MDYVMVSLIGSLPMRGIEDAAGGVDSARRSSNTKKATKMFIPEKNPYHIQL